MVQRPRRASLPTKLRCQPSAPRQRPVELCHASFASVNRPRDPPKTPFRWGLSRGAGMPPRDSAPRRDVRPSRRSDRNPSTPPRGRARRSPQQARAHLAVGPISFGASVSCSGLSRHMCCHVWPRSRRRARRNQPRRAQRRCRAPTRDARSRRDRPRIRRHTRRHRVTIARSGRALLPHSGTTGDAVTSWCRHYQVAKGRGREALSRVRSGGRPGRCSYECDRRARRDDCGSRGHLPASTACAAVAPAQRSVFEPSRTTACSEEPRAGRAPGL